MSASSRRVAAAASNWLAFAAALAVSFVLTPTYIRRLGPPQYDVFCVVESVLAYLTLLDLGIAACLVRQVARRHSAADPAGLNRVAAACFALFGAAGLAAFAAGAAVFGAMAGRLEARAGHPGDVLAFMLVMLLNLALSLPLSVFHAVLDGLEKFVEKSAVRLVTLALRTAGIFLVLDAGRGLFAVGAVVCAASVAEQLVLAALCVRALPGLSLHPRHVDRATLRTVRTSSVDAFLAMLSGRVTGQTGAILVGWFLPPGAVTAFATGHRLVDHAKTLLRTITTTLTPGVSAMEARGDWAGIRALYLAGTRGVLYAALPVNVGVVWFGEAFLTRWVGPETAAGAWPAAAVLATTLTISVAQSVASRVLYGLGRLRVFARLTLAEAAANLILSLALVGPFGVAGVAVGVAVPNVAVSVAVIVHARRVLGVGWGDILAAWAKPVAAVLLPAAVWVAGGPAAAAWPDLVAAGAAGLVPYAVLVAVLEVPAGVTRRVWPSRWRPAIPPLRRGPGTLSPGASAR